MKIKDGVNRIRILSEAITGYEYWTDTNGERKPVRLEEAPEEVPTDATQDKFGNYIKHFWAFAVWNYEENKVQILELTQATIQDAIFSLHMDEDWGDPRHYDIKINRIKEGDRVKYTVSPSPKTDLSLEAANAITANPVNLRALYKGENPFSDHVDTEEIIRTLG